MFKKSSICFIALLSLLIDPVTVSAVDTPPEYQFYFPIVSRLDRPDMVYIPAGPFQMGCDPDHNAGYECSYTATLHTVEMDAYYIDKYEVTNSQYDECERQGSCDPYHNGNHDNPAYANHPMEGFFWLGLEYCSWAGKHLPTEEEWEKAARGTDLRTFSWGDEAPTCELANFDGCVGGTVDVGTYPNGASPYGALDMTGNTPEWVNSDGFPYLTGSPEPMSPDTKVVRGGGYSNFGLFLTTSYRRRLTMGASIGFRCAVSEP